MFKKRYFIVLLSIFLIGVLALPSIAASAPKEIEWTALIPDDYNPDSLLAEYQEKYNIDELPDDSPILNELMRKIVEMRNFAPTNSELNGQLIKLPGFVVPLETDGQKSSEFLLVPYYGACIHVPPPPANQTVHVTTKDKEGANIRKLFDVVWVTGLIKTETLSTDLADAGYTITATKVEPYE